LLVGDDVPLNAPDEPPLLLTAAELLPGDVDVAPWLDDTAARPESGAISTLPVVVALPIPHPEARITRYAARRAGLTSPVIERI